MKEIKERTLNFLEKYSENICKYMTMGLITIGVGIWGYALNKKIKSQTTSISQVERILQDYDINKDGVLDRKELENYVAKK